MLALAAEVFRMYTNRKLNIELKTKQGKAVSWTLLNIMQDLLAYINSLLKT